MEKKCEHKSILVINANKKTVFKCIICGEEQNASKDAIENCLAFKKIAQEACNIINKGGKAVDEELKRLSGEMRDKKNNPKIKRRNRHE